MRVDNSPKVNVEQVLMAWINRFRIEAWLSQMSLDCVMAYQQLSFLNIVVSKYIYIYIISNWWWIFCFRIFQVVPDPISFVVKVSTSWGLLVITDQSVYVYFLVIPTDQILRSYITNIRKSLYFTIKRYWWLIPTVSL